MTTYISEQIDNLRDLLVDTADAQVPFLRKRAYLNSGMRAMWPRVHRIATDATTQFVADTYEYTLPAAVRGGRMFLIERSTPTDDDIFVPMEYEYELTQGAAGADVLRINFDPESWEDGYIRFSTALPLSASAAADYAASQSEVYTGPDYTAEGPVLYAMSRISVIPLDERVDFGRLSVQNQNRAASPAELMAVSSFWLDEFERRVEEWRMSLPGTRY